MLWSFLKSLTVNRGVSWCVLDIPVNPCCSANSPESQGTCDANSRSPFRTIATASSGSYVAVTFALEC